MFTRGAGTAGRGEGAGIFLALITIGNFVFVRTDHCYYLLLHERAMSIEYRIGLAHLPAKL